MVALDSCERGASISSILYTQLLRADFKQLDANSVTLSLGQFILTN